MPDLRLRPRLQLCVFITSTWSYIYVCATLALRTRVGGYSLKWTPRAPTRVTRRSTREPERRSTCVSAPGGQQRAGEPVAAACAGERVRG
jgi:hypothetical protein